MKVLIIEDEPRAASRLQSQLEGYPLPMEILAVKDSVKSATEWFLAHPQPDLIFMDIQLGDGLSFEIFDLVKISAPIIFTTAFDEYALKAFKVNSIDYLLKPIEEKQLYEAIKKYYHWFQTAAMPSNDYDPVKMQNIFAPEGNYRNRFLVRTGERLVAVPVSEIQFIFSREKGSFAQTKNGKRHLLDPTMEQIERMLNPQKFFRINRQMIVSAEAIQEMYAYSSSRLKLVLPEAQDLGEVIVSRERVNDFKAWLDR